MASTAVRTNLSLKGGLSINPADDFPANARVGATCLREGVLYLRTLIGDLKAWLPLNAPQDSHVHTQGEASKVWEVNHGFGGTVSIMAYGQDGNPIPATVANSEGIASVDVGSARTGYVVAFGLDLLIDWSRVDAKPATATRWPSVSEVDGLDAALGKKLDASKQYADKDAVAAIKADAAWNADQWDEAYSWGDHALAGYLKSVEWGDVGGKPVFSSVATSGQYADLSGTPDPADYATAAQGTKADNALPSSATAADANKLGGTPASDYLTVNDRIDLGELK